MRRLMMRLKDNWAYSKLMWKSFTVPEILVALSNRGLPGRVQEIRLQYADIIDSGCKRYRLLNFYEYCIRLMEDDLGIRFKKVPAKVWAAAFSKARHSFIRDYQEASRCGHFTEGMLARTWTKLNTEDSIRMLALKPDLVFALRGRTYIDDDMEAEIIKIFTQMIDQKEWPLPEVHPDIWPTLFALTRSRSGVPYSEHYY